MVVAYSIPGLQVLYKVETPPELLPAPPAHIIPDGELIQKSIVDVIWAPDSTRFAAHWTLAACRLVTLAMEDEYPRHGFSIHCARTGACQGSRELAVSGYLHPHRSTGRWDSTSSYLINWARLATLEFTGHDGTAWASSRQQRGFQPDSYGCTTYDWQGAPSGHFLSIMEGILDKVHEDVSTGTAVLAVCQLPRVSILETATGRIVQQYFPGGLVGRAIWSEQTDVCLLQDHGVVLAAAAMTTSLHTPVGVPPSGQKPAWQHHQLPFAHQPLSEPGPCARSNWSVTSQHVLSPCGKIVVGVQQMEAGASLQLTHWHRAGHLMSKQPVRSASTSVGILLNSPELGSLAWYPCKNTCVYAIFDLEGGLHIIDAKADCQVRRWSHAELSAGPSLGSFQDELRQPARSWPILAWSHDGQRLAACGYDTCVVLSL